MKRIKVCAKKLIYKRSKLKKESRRKSCNSRINILGSSSESSGSNQLLYAKIK
jgi:hypothetical protein